MKSAQKTWKVIRIILILFIQTVLFDSLLLFSVCCVGTSCAARCCFATPSPAHTHPKNKPTTTTTTTGFPVFYCTATGSQEFSFRNFWKMLIPSIRWHPMFYFSRLESGIPEFQIQVGPLEWRKACLFSEREQKERREEEREKKRKKTECCHSFEKLLPLQLDPCVQQTSEFV